MNRKKLVLLATIIGSGVAILDGIVVNLALPNIAASLHAQFADLQWIADGYLLSAASLIILGGSLGDIFGRKRIYLYGAGGFGAVSLLCGLAPNVRTLAILRIVQGVFGAMLVPGALAIINTNFSKEERGRAIGQWSAWSAILTAIGPLIGGYIIHLASWRWIFFINVPLLIICGWLAVKNFEESRDSRPRRLDYGGGSLAVLAFAGITYGLIDGPVNHWQLSSVLPLAVGLGLLPVFLWQERRRADPMIPLTLFKSRNFSGSNLMTFAMYGGLSGFMFSLVIYLQTKIGYTPLQAGASWLPVPICLMLLSSRMGALSHRLGPRLFMTAGPLLCGATILSLISYRPGDAYITYFFPRILLFGLGMAILVAPLTTTVMTSVKEADSGIASGINNAVSRLAGLIVIALLGLAGAGQEFRYGMILCGSLAVGAGIVSYALIQNQLRLEASQAAAAPSSSS